tara:strand:- start:1365 stop:1649 length:285 start_codon:yes stop_codon:yes gene_type:complete
MKIKLIVLIILISMASCHNKLTPKPYDMTSVRTSDSLLIGDAFKDGTNVTITSKRVKDGYMLNFFRDSIKVREVFISNGIAGANGNAKIIYPED